jgi:hypothetical protein
MWPILSRATSFSTKSTQAIDLSVVVIPPESHDPTPVLREVQLPIQGGATTDLRPLSPLPVGRCRAIPRPINYLRVGRCKASPRPINYLRVGRCRASPRPINYLRISRCRTSPRPINYLRIGRCRASPRPINYLRIGRCRAIPRPLNPLPEGVQGLLCGRACTFLTRSQGQGSAAAGRRALEVGQRLRQDKVGRSVEARQETLAMALWSG